MPKKIVLGLYTGGVVHATFPGNVLNLSDELHIADMYGGYIHAESSRVDSNRNLLLYDFLHKTEGDFLFILDEDMLHPPLMPIILASRDKQIISGTYFNRNASGAAAPVLYRVNGSLIDQRRGHGGAENLSFSPITGDCIQYYTETGAPDNDEPFIQTNPDGTWLQKGKLVDPVVRIDASGFGAILIRRDAAERLEEFCNAKKVPPLLDEPGLNGDLVFGKRCIEAGIEYWADLSVVAGHLTAKSIGMSEFSKYVFREVEKNGR